MNVIVLGSGLVGAPMSMDLAKEMNFNVSIADLSSNQFNRIPADYPVEKINADLSDKHQLTQLLANFDYVINALPGFMGFQTLKTIIEAGKDVVDISFFPEDPFELDELAKKMNVTAIMDCGVAPGMSYILAAYAAKQLDSCRNIEIYVGGLPKVRTLPFEYKAVFSPIDVIEEYTRPSRFKVDNKIVIKPALSEVELMEFEGVGTLEAFNSDGLRTLLQTVECPNMVEKTLRYPGQAEKMKFLRDIGFFSQEFVQIGNQQIRPVDLTAKLLFPLWEMKEGDEDITIMKIIVEGKKGNLSKRYTYELFDTFDTQNGIHSMARTTGYTATVALRMLAAGLYKHKGISPPEYIGNHPECVRFMLDGLKERGVVYKETVV